MLSAEIIDESIRKFMLTFLWFILHVNPTYLRSKTQPMKWRIPNTRQDSRESTNRSSPQIETRLTIDKKRRNEGPRALRIDSRYFHLFSHFWFVSSLARSIDYDLYFSSNVRSSRSDILQARFLRSLHWSSDRNSRFIDFNRFSLSDEN